MAPEKSNQPVVIYTAHHRIKGDLVLLKGEHFSDKLNQTERSFEAIQNASVYPLEGGVALHSAPCVAVNKDHIVMMIPREE